MGPKKEPKKEPQKRDQNLMIEEPLNIDFWKCVVVMAVERATTDRFVIREFMEEFSHGRRREIGLIDYESFVKKILNDFANGDLHARYSSLLNFASVLQEASEYVNKNTLVPASIMAKVIKIILFYLREESLIILEKKAAGPPDPLVEMAERSANFGTVDTKKKETTKKKDEVPKVKPPSATKEATTLLKRGERVKDDQCIDDAPLNGYFNLYILLTGFYQPDIPLELIKLGVPLHGLLCIDTSGSSVKEVALRTPNKFQRNFEAREVDIENFWDGFLKILWDPKISPFFKDTIFQVYKPRSMRCDKKNLREFIYREISYLMYDLSDFKRQLNNYLNHMKLWDVEEKQFEEHLTFGVEDVPNDCATVPVVLQCIIDTICGNDWNYSPNTSSNSINSEKESEWSSKLNSLSAQGWYGSTVFRENWNQILRMRGDFEMLKIYTKTKELDAIYDLDHADILSHASEILRSENDSSQTCCLKFQSYGDNMKEALSPDGTFHSYWKKYDSHVDTTLALDYCLYPILMAKVLCPFLSNIPVTPLKWNTFYRRNSNFEPIENLQDKMRKPHFTVTESSRNILKAFPYNMKETSRDFFNLAEFKIVSPEKLKASSAPQFRVTTPLKLENFFNSEIFSGEISKNLFENLREFLGEEFFANTNGFDFLEFLGKPQFIEKKNKYWDCYNCVDHTYSVANDCIFVVLHNRMDNQNVHHETFNEVLRTKVGLRDFYEYVLDDEAQWFANQEESLMAINKKKSSNDQLIGDFSDSDFWLVNSLKYQNHGFEREIEKLSELSKAKSMSAAKQMKDNCSGDMLNAPVYDFEGYDISDMIVQYSGLKTVYYSNDCSMTVELLERLYGKQDLGIHITAAGHTLHLHSYVCPEPHVLDPFTFHITYKNGVIVGFERRFIETLEEVEEIIESRTTVKGKKNSAELSTRVIKRLVPKIVRDEEFIYDMAVSLPNGLRVLTIRKAVKPCYIKQQHLSKTEKISELEISRLFLPNGDVVKMLRDDTVEILRPNTSIVTANLKDFNGNGESERFQFNKFHIIRSEGHAETFERGEVKSSKRFQILQNVDLDENQVFFRRRDGTNYVLQGDGTLCVEFKDGTKISSSLIFGDESVIPQSSEYYSTEQNLQEGETYGEDEPETNFVFIYMKVTMEHPDYATVIYDTQVQKWVVLLPQDSAITIDSDGQYTVDIDSQTALRADSTVIQMNRYGAGRQLECAATADLSVFENSDGSVFCHMEDINGKIFIVEANSNCYILDDDRTSDPSSTPKLSLEDISHQSAMSEFVASADLQTTPSVLTEKSSKLSRNSKYFAIKRDLTGFELLHKEDLIEVLNEKKKGSLIFIERLPGTENRLFVLLTPGETNVCKKWEVKTILPNPRYVPQSSKKQRSSTYGVPPSWMHPFPKRKNKFKPPELISCRIFIEIKKTEISPPIGEIDCYFCDIDEMDTVPEIPSDGVEEYLKKLSDNDQDLLKDMYTSVAESLINEKKKSKPVNSEKLEHYLKLSKYYVQLQDYHKRCIRYHSVPNYFHHPAGMSWLILNDLVNRLKITESEIEEQVGSKSVMESSETLNVSLESTSAYSYEEVEYNLSHREVLTYSDLSYRSDVSAQTAPAVLRTGGMCRCKLRKTKDISSAPAIKYQCKEEIPIDNFEQKHSRKCDFHENEIEMLETTQNEMPFLTLEDLLCLALI